MTATSDTEARDPRSRPASVGLAGETLAALSREIVRIRSEHYGKGAPEAKSFLCDDLLVCVMKGGLTQLERNLLDHGDGDLVRQLRLRFQTNMAATFISAVERISGHRVLTYQSQVLFDPDHVIEMFVLGPPVATSAANSA